MNRRQRLPLRLARAEAVILAIFALVAIVAGLQLVLTYAPRSETELADPT
jgi:hypothetical protein